ncbi:MAG: hypothetical protein RJA86_1861 [Pseudomonadota bacterium]|jgi:16S rRNA U1498 N3-methylase RsmE|nr:hypothetical protein [Agitococcus sp.]
MRTISIEIDDKAYPHLLEVLRLLPTERCHVFADDGDNELSASEINKITKIQAKLAQGDDSDFIDWQDVKRSL